MTMLGRAYAWALRRVFAFALRRALGEALLDLDADQLDVALRSGTFEIGTPRFVGRICDGNSETSSP